MSSEIGFFDRVNVEVRSCGLGMVAGWCINASEDFLFLDGILDKLNFNSYTWNQVGGVKKREYEVTALNYVATLAKIIVYLTVVIPLLALGIKALYRFNCQEFFEIKESPEEDKQKRITSEPDPPLEVESFMENKYPQVVWIDCPSHECTEISNLMHERLLPSVQRAKSMPQEGEFKIAILPMRYFDGISSLYDHPMDMAQKRKIRILAIRIYECARARGGWLLPNTIERMGYCTIKDKKIQKEESTKANLESCIADMLNGLEGAREFWLDTGDPVQQI